MHHTSGAWQVTLGATVDEHAAKNNWNIINRESQERGPFPKKENILIFKVSASRFLSINSLVFSMYRFVCKFSLSNRNKKFFCNYFLKILKST